MAIVGVQINGKEYHLACDEGQEQHVFELSQELDLRVRQMSGQVGQAPESMLLLMSALTLADELAEAQNEVRTLEREVTRLARDLRDERSVPKEAADTELMLDEVADRIHLIANRLQIG